MALTSIRLAALITLACAVLAIPGTVLAMQEPVSDNPDERPVIGTMRDGRHIKMIGPDTFFTSQKVDFTRFPSSITEGIEIAAAVYKPERPGPILLMSHGWHGSVEHPGPETPNPYPGFLTIQVDMRGRAYSLGEPDANGYELYDFYDALTYARHAYAEHISDPDRVHFLGGSGGGGNALAVAGRFPDLFASVVAKYPMSDYAAWYEGDAVGEFRDEMDIWIGASPAEAPEAYAVRSGLTAVPNILSPLYIVHGETDIRVPSSHSRNYASAAKMLDRPVTYLELAGVGSMAHLGNITSAQEADLAGFVDTALTHHAQAPQLPRKGLLVVPGYIRTRYFEVMLGSIDQVGLLAYDLDAGEAQLIKGTGRIRFLPEHSQPTEH
ncbi:alpha/beta fold hydrolase [Parvularcula flava]|uniref:Alpha/beta fold hydrolase n=1 Tax=Aquisalinus luteolus TaxID=1566827 RepID=A0A8J3EQ06_9PROT|nr:alpha/beta fold hydrolase [Aquisalinus luteolus]NHK26418.1 alpha/beta fold hydrolase [Aquisalinus luteolus]GGH92277.1 hypothetical protein GCM10011355_01390 [Aquisalinus luteolus]